MIDRVWAGLMERFGAATPRERAGLALAVATGAIAMAIASFDWAMGAADAERSARIQRAEAQAAFERDSDGAFQQRLAEDVNKVWRWSIVETSESLVRAQAAPLVESLALQAGLANVEVAVADSADEGGSVGSIAIRLGADFDWPSFMALLEALHNSETSFTIHSIEVSGGADGAPRLNLLMKAPFLLEAPQ